MLDLNQIENSLKNVIKELRDIDESLSGPQRLKKKNEKSIIVKMPKILLLTKICQFLTLKQTNYLSTICSALRKTIYGPIGFKILSKVTSPYPIKVKKIRSQFQKKMKRVSMQSYEDPHEDYEDEKFIYQERTKYKQILQKKYLDYLKYKEKFEVFREKVRVQNTQIFKLKQTLLFYNKIREQLAEQNRVHKEKLKSLSQGFSAKLKDMDTAIDLQMKEITKLQNQKQALAGKVREYQHEIQVIKIDSEKKKQILKRLQNYLLYKQL